MRLSFEQELRTAFVTAIHEIRQMERRVDRTPEHCRASYHANKKPPIRRLHSHSLSQASCSQNTGKEKSRSGCENFVLNAIHTNESKINGHLWTQLMGSLKLRPVRCPGLKKIWTPEKIFIFRVVHPNRARLNGPQLYNVHL